MPVTVRGSSELSAKLAEHAARARDPEPALAVAAAELQELLEETEAAERAPDGRPWEPRKTTSRRRDGRRAYARSDTRRGSLMRRSGRMLGELAARATKLAIDVTDSVPYLVFHTRGTRRMPQREVMPSAEMRTGPIGAWRAALPGRIAQFIVTGNPGRPAA